MYPARDVPALIPESELVGDDWLIDDVKSSSKRKMADIDSLYQKASSGGGCSAVKRRRSRKTSLSSRADEDLVSSSTSETRVVNAAGDFDDGRKISDRFPDVYGDGNSEKEEDDVADRNRNEFRIDEFDSDCENIGGGQRSTWPASLHRCRRKRQVRITEFDRVVEKRPTEGQRNDSTVGMSKIPPERPKVTVRGSAAATGRLEKNFLERGEVGNVTTERSDISRGAMGSRTAAALNAAESGPQTCRRHQTR